MRTSGMRLAWMGFAGALLLAPGTLAAQTKGNWACPPGVLNPDCADQARGRPIDPTPRHDATSGSSSLPSPSRESRDIGAPDAAKDVGAGMGRSGDREPPAPGYGKADTGKADTKKE